MLEPTDVMATVVPDVKKRTLQPIVAQNVEPGSTVHTDEPPTLVWDRQDTGMKP